jgi:hypothetical protein
MNDISEANEVFYIKIIIMESALHKDIKKYKWYRDSKNFTKEHKYYLGHCVAKRG